MFKSFVLLAGLGVSSGMAVGSVPSARRVAVRAQGGIMMADIVDTAKTLEGPVIFWGSDGVALGHEESDVKGYDNFGKFVAAVEAAGLTDTLKGAGPYTVLAPTDAAFDDFQGEVTADILKYHVIPGKVPLSSIDKDQDTVQGGKLHYDRRFRKTFLDSAMVGITSSGASKGQVYPVDVACDNGLIHAIDCVLVPGAFTPEA